MANEKPAPTIADYMAIAIGPALIMALVGSLVFFLVAVFYVGDFTFRLDWILFFFVFAAVLIARMSMQEEGSPRAVLYGLALGIPTFIGLQSFVEYPADSSAAAYSWGINLLLMGIVWWCAHRLTLDCTQVEDDEAADGQGLLEAAGLDQKGDDEEAEEGEKEPAPAGWWERYKRYQEKRKKRRTPGVWVIYFSLASLPLFGLGQSLIPVDDAARRRYVFWLMVVYVGSGLGLLLTTCFLGLRRYLRQRQVQMTTAMTTLWLTLGGGLIVGLLVLGAFLPRPQAEYPLVEMAGLGSKERNASPWAVLRDSPGKGKGQPSSDSPKGGSKEGAAAGKDGSGQPNSSDPKAAQGNSGQRNGSGDKNGSGSQQNSQGNQQGGDKGNQQGSGQGNQQGGDKGNQQGGDKSNNSGQQGGDKPNSQGQPSGEKGNGQGKQEGDKGGGQGKQPGDKGGGRPPDQNSQPNSGNNPRKQDEQSGGQKKPPDDQQGNRKDGDQKQAGSEPSAQPPSSPLSGLWSLLAALAAIMKWIVFGLIVLIVGFLVLRAVLQFLANFTTWAKGLLDALRSLWQGLFGWLSVSGKGEAAAEEVKGGPPPRPFSSYRNPFHEGSAGHWPPEKLLRYTFEAFQAWAWERELGRRLDETALEFADRIGGEVAALEQDARRLALLYARSLYARGPLPATCAEAVEQFWERLEAVAEQPLSA
jgi:hypothetical protein